MNENLTNAEIGARIKERRLALNMTLEQIAYDIGIAISTVHRYETGAIDKIKLPVLEAIARSVKVNPDWLIGKSTYQPLDFAAPRGASDSEWDVAFREWLVLTLEGADNADLEAMALNREALERIAHSSAPLTFTQVCEIVEQIGGSIDHITGLADEKKPATFASDGLSQKKRALMARVPDLDDSEVAAVNVAFDTLIALRKK